MSRRPSTVRSIAIDCRWLGNGGSGRTTEQLLLGLKSVGPTIPIYLWGPSRFRHLAWPGTTWVPEEVGPTTAFGQVPPWRLPRADLMVFMQQQRPLVTRRPTAVFIYDTTQVQYAPTRAMAIARKAYLAASAHLATEVFTISDWSRDNITRELGVSEAKVHVLDYPIPGGIVDGIVELGVVRAEAPYALYVGNGLPHKNLERLILSFQRTVFARDGAQLVLAGGPWPTAIVEQPFVRLVTAPTDRELVALYAGCTCVVQPSLAEGFGLPVREASAAGIPVAHSGVGPLCSLKGQGVFTFTPTNLEMMAQAIDAAAACGKTDTAERRLKRAQTRPRQARDVSTFAAALLAHLGVKSAATSRPGCTAR